MKLITYLLFILFFSSDSFAQQKEILYKIDIQRRFTKEALKKSKKRSNKENARVEISAYQNPKDEFYSLKIHDNSLKLDYVEALDNDDNQTHIQVKNYPLGKESYRLKGDSLVYYQYSIEKEKYYSIDTLVKGNWVEAQKDSVILGYKVHQLKLENNLGVYSAWFTKDLPSDLGIGSLSYYKGFILAYEFLYKPTPILKTHVIKVYPYKIKKLRKKKRFKFTRPEKVYAQEEIKKIISERNKVLNRPIEIKN